MKEAAASPIRFSMEDADFFRTLIHNMRYGAGLQNRLPLADIVAKTIRSETALTPPTASASAKMGDAVAALRTDGFWKLGKLIAPDAVEKIRGILVDARLEGTVAPRSSFTRDTAPMNENVGTVIQDGALSSCGELFGLANHPDILAIVDSFLGAPPTIQYYTAWWSFAGRADAQEAQFFHYDRNCFRFVKLFIYLTDVPQGAGPHVYVRGSHDIRDWMNRLESVKKKEPAKAQRLLAMINALRKSDIDVAEFFDADQFETFTGQAGEGFLVDTSGIHKGQLPVTNDRLSFQATYALLPLLKDGARPVVFPGLIKACLERHGSRLEQCYIEYANRIAVIGERR